MSYGEYLWFSYPDTDGQTGSVCPGCVEKTGGDTTAKRRREQEGADFFRIFQIQRKKRLLEMKADDFIERVEVYGEDRIEITWRFQDITKQENI